MTKAEAERAIRHLVHEWRKESGHAETPAAKLSFFAFLQWLQERYSHYLQFRSSTSVESDVHRWFDDELGLRWTN